MNKFKKFFYSQKAAPYVFVLPFIISFLLFWIYPLCSTITMSFQDIKPTGTEWVGISNFQKLLKDKIFHTAIKNSFQYMVLTLVLLIPFPMFFAVLMDSRLVKAKGFWKACLYVPALTSVVISGTLFRLMFSEYPTGQMNVITTALGLGTFKWLKMKATGLGALLLVACWRWTGVNMLYFISGLKAIDTAMYEAADIDGLAMFMESYMLWAGPDSPNNIGLTIVGYLYKRGITKNQLGYGSAVGIVLLVIALAINIVQLVVNGTLGKEEK